MGKTTLLSRFCVDLGRTTRVLWGSCDALFTPRPLGPLFDIAGVTGGLLEELVGGGARAHEVVAALAEELGSRAPTVVVLEDVHQADEASLDVIRLLGRKVGTLPALVVATYREDELSGAHPLRVVLGELASARDVERLEVASLSPGAVAELARSHEVDADELFRRTAGNPFFVTEVLAAGADAIPHTVRDAVLARAARLTSSARRLLEAVAAVPPQAELWLLEAIAGDSLADLEECLASGMLRSGSDGVAFRHEVARLTVEAATAPDRKLALHRAALDALEGDPAGADVDRLAHHAVVAGDAGAVLRLVPAAAARAAALGAHREAAAHYARSLPFAEILPSAARAELFERYSHECFLTDQGAEATNVLERAIELHREMGDARKQGTALCSLSKILWCPGNDTESERAAHAAVALLERLPAGRELASAYANVSAVYMNREDAERAAVWGERALELADRLGDTGIRIDALINLGTVRYVTGDPGGREQLEQSLALSRQGGFEEQAGRALVHLIWGATRQRDHALANEHLAWGLAFAENHGLDLWRIYLLAYRAVSELNQGRWAEAVECASLVLRESFPSKLPPALALTTIGLVRARRGEPERWAPLDEALALVQSSRELQRLAPIGAARAEAAWLEGEPEKSATETEAAYELALRRGAEWPLGELACWRWRAGLLDQPPPAAAEPYGLQILGEWRRASELWQAIGCPYEAAMALSDADDEDALRNALAALHGLGALPAAAIVARRLRERGARGLPRGPRSSTRQNPANLTARELDVLALVAEGLRNAQIAERLFVSEKTVGHHVSAVLRKLAVSTRGEASAEAVRLGLSSQDR